MKDIFGKAILDYQQGNYTEDILTETSISEEDVLPVPYLFRGYDQMPEIEQKALELCKGHVLDIGCGAGSHALYLQEERKLKVSAIDISEGAIKACKKRGITDARHTDIQQLQNEKFDTLLLLMNGAGMCGYLKNITSFLQHLRSILNKGGQILLDSSDIIYMYDEDEEGGKWIPADMEYYGELEFRMSYKGEKSDPFPWLYIDYNTLQNAAVANGFNCELILEGEHYDYLARLQPVE
ncbi:methyltransferase domain-containing protein [Leptobacterium flavescens]|uniref:Methyltransferase domain-containing protein n=1 Tax=Leptobacterium flavescens TaxID=472055 RepID=A0A6P0UXR7_9FLAO|nr:class I SAM-dependent methyltransferase [Leptobacterium flavescens]NER15256.1 methyltransferase domain-containing protein [Leptobacterium flavescens]